MQRTGGAFLLTTLLVLASGCAGAKANDTPTPPSSVVQASGDAIPDAGSIVGTVVDESLNPIVGAQVALLDQKLSAATDATGSFAFQNLAPGSYKVDAVALGYQSAEKSVEVGANQEARVQFTLAAIAVTKPYVEVIGPLQWYFDCRLGNAATTGACVPVTAANPNDKASMTFKMGADVVGFVGEMRWQPGSFATSKALRLSFSYTNRTSSHWFCTATSGTPVKWDYRMEDTQCVTRTYCGVGASQLPSAEPKKPTPDLKLTMYTNTPFSCPNAASPTNTTDVTHVVELSLQQKSEAALTMFHGEVQPNDYTAFPDQ